MPKKQGLLPLSDPELLFPDQLSYFTLHPAVKQLSFAHFKKK